MSGRFTLGKEERLSHKKQIDRLFNEGHQFIFFPYRIFYQVNEAPADATVQVLISVPKRKFKHAVDRNRIRRVTREAFRLHKYVLVDSLVSKSLKLQIGIVYIGSTAQIGLAEIDEKLTGSLRKLTELI